MTLCTTVNRKKATRMATASVLDTFKQVSSRGAAAPVVMLSMLAMLMLPLPPFVLDILFSFNIALSLVILLAGRYLALKRVAPHWALEALDSLGATAYALIGLGGLIFASVYLQNYLPLGTPGHLLSAGMMPLNSIAVGLEVTGAFLLTWTEFLDQDLLVGRGEL